MNSRSDWRFFVALQRETAYFDTSGSDGISKAKMLNIDDATRCRSEARAIAAQEARTYCLHELFEQQVDQRGEAVALVCGAVKLTYSALESRANRVANYLRQIGMGPGDL